MEQKKTLDANVFLARANSCASLTQNNNSAYGETRVVNECSSEE